MGWSLPAPGTVGTELKSFSVSLTSQPSLVLERGMKGCREAMWVSLLETSKMKLKPGKCFFLLMGTIDRLEGKLEENVCGESLICGDVELEVTVAKTKTRASPPLPAQPSTACRRCEVGIRDTLAGRMQLSESSPWR